MMIMMGGIDQWRHHDAELERSRLYKWTYGHTTRNRGANANAHLR